MTTPAIPGRIAALREAMHERGIAACIVPTADPHLSEYLPAHWQAREWLSGFTGSAGTLVVTPEFAGLWTDSRYFSQAGKQLAGSGIELMKLNVPHTPEHVEWLCAQLHKGDKIACAADMLSLASERSLRERLAQHGAELVEDDLPGAIWSDRPLLPHAPIHEHPLEYAIHRRAQTSSPACGTPCSKPARPTTSSPRWTRSRGYSTCAAATSTTTRCSCHTC